jgi:hypothetical protein
LGQLGESDDSSVTQTRENETMDDHYRQAGQWLDREDSQCREGRIERLAWLASALPHGELLTFPGGWMAKHLFEETRHCFIYGQFLAAIVLGFAFVERTLAAIFYASGRGDLEKAPVSELFREAVRTGCLTADEYAWLDRARKLRNPVTHFRRPLYRDTVENRSVTEGSLPYWILEEDARHVVLAAMRVVAKRAV